MSCLGSSAHVCAALNKSPRKQGAVFSQSQHLPLLGFYGDKMRLLARHSWLLGVFLVAACGGSTSLESTAWRLTDIASDAGDLTGPLPEVEVTAHFDAEQITGDAGCNRYFGSWVEDADSVAIGPLGSTQRSCIPSVNEQEFRYLALLQEAMRFEINGEVLTLFDENVAAVLIYEMLEPTQLAGTTWEATGVNNGKGGVVSVIIGSTITAEFNEDGTLSGNGGCNNYSAQYEAGDESISIGVIASTRTLCPIQEESEQEQWYFTALENADTWRIDGDRLELRDEDGALQVSFQRTGN